MTRRRWIADEFSADRAVLTGTHAAHLSRALRARVGQQFEVACGDKVWIATVSRVSDDRVEFALGEEIRANAIVPVTLLLAIFKFDRMEWAIEKCTELNVTSIIPVIAHRTEKHLALTAEKRVERWRRIAREASEQSRRTTPPEIVAPIKLSAALELQYPPLQQAVLSPPNKLRETDVRDGKTEQPWASLTSDDLCRNQPRSDLRIVLAETEHEASLTDVLRSRPQIRSLALAIGPEGGWTAEELRGFAAMQWLSASLGDTILRAETAAIAALAIARADT